jgi:nucleoid-associated protein YgaU
VPVATPLQPPVGPGLLAPAPTGAPAPKSPYIVVADDKGFYGIAKKVYGDSKYLYLIAKANPTVQSERLTPGMKLTIPPLPPEAVAAAAAGLRPGTPAPPPGGEGAYVVKEGETLWSIAEKQYGDGIYFVRIAEANPTMGDPQKLRPGQKLVIPKLTVASGMTATRPAQPAKVLSPGQKSYKVVQGDLLWDIAVREYGDGSLYPVIVEANPGLVDPNHLPVGKEIIIPSRSHAEAIVRKPAAGTAARTGETATARPPAPSADKGYVPGKPYWD